MNCEFCQHELYFSHNEGIESNTLVYYCKSCPILMHFYFPQNSSEKSKIVFFLNKKGRSYAWVNNYKKNTSYIYDMSVNNKVIMGGIRHYLVEFPKIMKIDPTNVQEKLSFYLVWI